MRTHPFPSLVKLQELFLYDAERGVLISRRTGGRVGEMHEKGYLRVSVSRAKIRIHHIVWFLETGRWPDMLDHVNGDRADNRFCNLREATYGGNAANRGAQKNNKLGVKGVRRARGNMFQANIQYRRRSIFLGHFNTVEAAAAAYAEAARKYFGEFAKC
jgi:hypothetical protein